MEFRRITVPISVAANAAGRRYFTPPLADDGTSSKVWEYVDLDITPNETSAVHATDYVDIALYRDDGTPTQITVTRSTNSGTGSALTQGTPTNPATHASATGDKLKATRTDPFYLLVDSTPGAGVAVDIVATLTVREYTV